MSRQNSIRSSNLKTIAGQRKKMKLLISKRQIWNSKKLSKMLKISSSKIFIMDFPPFVKKIREVQIKKRAFQ